jgi:ribosome hibernation promoting factor
MEVEVRIQSVDVADAVRTYAARRIRFALGRVASRVGRVVIRMSDVNGARGGVDQCCHISAELLPTGKVVLEQTDADLFTAIDRAAERVGQAFRREIQRLRDARSRRESVRVP